MCRNYDAGECIEPGCTGRVTCRDFNRRCVEHDVNGRGLFYEDDEPVDKVLAAYAAGDKFLTEWARHEHAPRTTCPECFFELADCCDAHRTSHAPGCRFTET